MISQYPDEDDDGNGDNANSVSRLDCDFVVCEFDVAIRLAADNRFSHDSSLEFIS